MQVEQVIEQLENRAAALRKKWKEATLSDPRVFGYRVTADEFDKMAATLRSELEGGDRGRVDWHHLIFPSWDGPPIGVKVRTKWK